MYGEMVWWYMRMYGYTIVLGLANAHFQFETESWNVQYVLECSVLLFDDMLYASSMQ
jgi:hypothetical protein